MGIEFFLQLLINGILLGGFYATMALGFSTIWGVMRLINLAHGEFLLMGAFATWFFFNPTREQALTIASVDSSITFAAIFFASIIFGFIISEMVIRSDSGMSATQRRVIGYGLAGGFGVNLFILWSFASFEPVVIPVMVIMMIGIELSIGFMISHVIMGTVLERGTIWTRRLIGYGFGTVITLVGYLLWQGSGFVSIDPFLSLPLIFVMFFAFGYVLQRGFLNKLVEGPYLTLLLVTFAIAIMLQTFGLNIYSADPRRINITYTDAIKLSDSLTLAPAKILTLIVSALMVIGLAVFLKRTRIGYAIRAAAQNKMAARLMGINIHETYALTFAISLGLTAMAGGMMGTFQPVTPITGGIWTLRAFSIVALGGLGKVEGVVVGGLVLGVTESLVAGNIGAGWAIAVSFILLVVMLVIRPQGLTGGLVPVEE
jgi:branched-chain amino acid transport system permease protein